MGKGWEDRVLDPDIAAVSRERFAYWTDERDGHLIWAGNKNSWKENTPGHFSVDTREGSRWGTGAHRAAIVLRDGFLAGDMGVTQTCGEPLCVLADHLVVRSRGEVSGAARKGKPRKPKPDDFTDLLRRLINVTDQADATAIGDLFYGLSVARTQDDVEDALGRLGEAIYERDAWEAEREARDALPTF